LITLHFIISLFVVSQIAGIVGPFDIDMLRKGRNVDKYFAKEPVCYPQGKQPDLNPSLSLVSAHFIGWLPRR
jgi:hypothetical protein